MDVTPAALDTLKLFFPPIAIPGGASRPMPRPLFPNPKLGVEGDLRGVTEFGVSSPSSSLPVDPLSVLPSLEFDNDLQGVLREEKGD